MSLPPPFGRAACLAMTLASACTALEPQVGPLQEAGTTGGGDGAACMPPDQAYATDGASGPYAPNDPRCLPDSGLVGNNPCDLCEAQNCCPTRLSCFTDVTCNCGDQGLDPCVAAATGMQGAGYGAAPACVTQFSATGAAAVARVNCDQTQCKSACGF